MQEYKRKNLEGMLKAVEDIKSQYYVGTCEAAVTVKKISKIYQNPETASELINKTLEDKFDDITYRAAPQRVIGLIDIFRYASLVLERKMVFQNNNNCRRLISDIINPLCNTFEIDENNLYDLRQDFSHIIDESRDICLPYFKNANFNSVISDSEFKQNSLKYTFQYLDDKVSLSDISTANENLINDFYEDLDGQNWENKLSREYFEKKRGTTIAACFRELDTGKIIDRLFHDCLDHRFEYRRQIISKWIIDRDHKNYAQILKDVENSISRRVEQYEEQVKQNSPMVILENQQKLIDRALFLRRLLGSEKNFIERFLKS